MHRDPKFLWLFIPRKTVHDGSCARDQVWPDELGCPCIISRTWEDIYNTLVLLLIQAVSPNHLYLRDPCWQRELAQLKGSSPADLGGREVHGPSSPSIVHLHSDTQKKVDETLRFYLSNRGLSGCRIFSCRNKFSMLQPLSFKQNALQHLACDSSSTTVVQVSCLDGTFIEFKSVLLLNTKIRLYLGTSRPHWPSPPGG